MNDLNELLKGEIKIISQLLSIMIKSQNDDGSLEFDGDESLLTHHLILTLHEWDPKFFKYQIDKAVKWFLNIGINDKYSRDNKDFDFDPFKLIALKTVNSRNTKKYINTKFPILKTKHVRKQGYAVLDMGFRNAQDIADVFPTLSAVDILLKDESIDSLKLAKNSLLWVRDAVTSNLVYENYSSILGFIALLLTKYELLSKNFEFNEWKRQSLNKLINLQEDGLWEKSAYQSCYIFYDLAYIYSIEENANLIEPIKRFLNILNEDFFYNYKILGQHFFLVSSSLIRGFSHLFSNQQIKNINKQLMNEAFANSSEYFHIKKYIDSNLEEINRIKKDLMEKKYIPVNPKVFTERYFKFDEKKVFVIMPFGKKEKLLADEKIGTKYIGKKDFEKIYNKILKPAIESLNLVPIRADSSFSPGTLINKIWTKINESSLVIAVLTYTNPNVLYEVGISHTLGKPVIFYTEDDQYVPSDLKGIEYVKHGDDLFGEEENEINKIRTAIMETLKAYGTQKIM